MAGDDLWLWDWVDDDEEWEESLKVHERRGSTHASKKARRRRRRHAEEVMRLLKLGAPELTHRARLAARMIEEEEARKRDEHCAAWMLKCSGEGKGRKKK